jgi:hypothetical protein
MPACPVYIQTDVQTKLLFLFERHEIFHVIDGGAVWSVVFRVLFCLPARSER